MAVDVILPKVDMDMTTGIISKWHVKNGDAVTKGQALFDMETDKSAIEIESPAAGTINNIAQTGKAIDIGNVVALIYASGEAQQEIKQIAPAVANAKVELIVEASKTIVVTANSTGLRATPLARRLARQNNISLKLVKGSGPRGRIVAADIQNKSAEGLGKTANQAHLTISCDLTQLIELRDRINQQSPACVISNNDFVIKAMALALLRVPAADPSGKNEIAEKSLSQIALHPDQTQFASTSIANVSSHKIESFGVPVIAPFTTALAVGAPHEQFVPVNNQPVLKTLMKCTLTCDLEAVSIEVAAELLAAFKVFVEEPALMLA
jgi:pyruvate dehydrogenase E2 component (dihydrolipoamide acetyltransferase)